MNKLFKKEKQETVTYAWWPLVAIVFVLVLGGLAYYCMKKGNNLNAGANGSAKSAGFTISCTRIK